MSKTLAQLFIEKAVEIMPHQSELQDLDVSINSKGHIDEIMFRKGEYIGGMASVLLEILYASWDVYHLCEGLYQLSGYRWPGR